MFRSYWPSLTGQLGLSEAGQAYSLWRFYDLYLTWPDEYSMLWFTVKVPLALDRSIVLSDCRRPIYQLEYDLTIPNSLQFHTDPVPGCEFRIRPRPPYVTYTS